MLGDYAAQGCASAVGAGCAGAATSTGVAIQETVWLGDIPVAVLTPTATHFIHADHLNTPRVITDTTNKVIWRWDSDPFGVTLANEDPDNNGVKFTYNLRFPGQYFDKETGLHYNYFRDYDPRIGRYVQSDPIGLRGGLNTYAYVGNNPLYWIDPDGSVKQDPNTTYKKCGVPEWNTCKARCGNKGVLACSVQSTKKIRRYIDNNGNWIKRIHFDESVNCECGDDHPIPQPSPKSSPVQCNDNCQKSWVATFAVGIGIVFAYICTSIAF